jgi:dienelactone hydrolase
MRPKIIRPFVAAIIALAAFLGMASHANQPPLPDGVAKQISRVVLTGRAVTVDIYAQTGATNAPVVIVAHGFSRGRRHMAGWGGMLAANGFIAAIPDQPTWADAPRNARALAELLAKLRSGDIAQAATSGRRAAMVGFSLGGLSTLMAASQAKADAWVGLDPVDMGGLGRRAATGNRIPSAVLLAEPAPWNHYGTAQRIIRSLPNPPFSLRVRGATHCDVEWPSDWLGRIACGPTETTRRDVFARYTLAFLRATLMEDPTAAAILRAAPTDPAIADDKRP